MTKETLKQCSIDDCDKPSKNGDKYCSMHRARLLRTGRLGKKSLMERINEKIERITESGCWIWTGYVTEYGYGRFRVNGKKKLIHRVMYEQIKGEIPNGMIACHICDIPSCVNPDHIFIGTDQDNVDDAIKKGRIDPVKRAKDRWLKCPTLRK